MLRSAPQGTAQQASSAPAGFDGAAVREILGLVADQLSAPNGNESNNKPGRKNAAVGIGLARGYADATNYGGELAAQGIGSGGADDGCCSLQVLDRCMPSAR